MSTRIELTTSQLLTGLRSGNSYSLESGDGYHTVAAAPEPGFVMIDGKSETIATLESWIGYNAVDWNAPASKPLYDRKFSGYLAA